MMDIERIGGLEVELRCSCGYEVYMDPSCGCGSCPSKIPKLCPSCKIEATKESLKVREEIHSQL